MLRGNCINSEAVIKIKRLIAEMYQIQADIDEENERIGARIDRYVDEVAKLKGIYRKNELISDAIDSVIDALALNLRKKITKSK